MQRTLTAYECQQQQAFVGGLALFSTVVLWILTNVAVVLTYAIYRKFGDRLLP